MLTKLAMFVTGIILLGATVAMAAPNDEGSNINIEMAIEQNMAAASLYTPTKAAPSAFDDDSPALYVPTSAEPAFRVIASDNDDAFTIWDQ